MRALVLSGGGSKGAWQAGVLEHWLADEGRTHDLYCGVSVGALQAAFLAMYPAGCEGTGARDLVQVWEGLRTSRVRRQHRPWGFLHALWRPNLFDSRPMQRLVRRHLDAGRIARSGKRLRVGTVSLDDGRYRLFDERDECIVDAVLASAAFPAMLEPIEIDGTLYSDGGLREVTPLAAAIDAGATEVDVLLTAARGLPPNPPARPERPNAIRLAIRALEILLNEVLENDLQVATRTNELVQCHAAPGKRYVEVRVLRPSRPLPSGPLDFEATAIRSMVQQGREDAAGWEAGRGGGSRVG